MKTKIIIILLLLFGTFTFSQNRTLTVNKDSISKENIKDYDAYIYKCYDDSTKKELYIDFIVPGQVTFFVNRTFITYEIDVYKITARDSSWANDSISFYLSHKMPVDSIVLNSNESKIFIYSMQRDGCPRVNVLRIVHSLSGMQETLYLRKKKKYYDFKYGDKNTPEYIKY